MNAKRFLIMGGALLLLLGGLGFFGIIGPTAERSIFGEDWYFDNVQNAINAFLGVAALSLVALKLEALYRPVTFLIGLVGLFFGILSLFLSSIRPNLGSVNLENPSDLVFHLFISLWALVAWWKSSVTSVPSIKISE